MNELRFYFDESVELAVSEQISRLGIDVVSAHSLDRLSDTDAEHLQRATEMGRVFCTYDDDFLVLAQSGVEHAGILFATQDRRSIGDWVREVRFLHATLTSDEAQGQILFVKKRI